MPKKHKQPGPSLFGDVPEPKVTAKPKPAVVQEQPASPKFSWQDTLTLKERPKPPPPAPPPPVEEKIPEPLPPPFLPVPEVSEDPREIARISLAQHYLAGLLKSEHTSSLWPYAGEPTEFSLELSSDQRSIRWQQRGQGIGYLTENGWLIFSQPLAALWSRKPRLAFRAFRAAAFITEELNLRPRKEEIPWPAVSSHKTVSIPELESVARKFAKALRDVDRLPKDFSADKSGEADGYIAIGPEGAGLMAISGKLGQLCKSAEAFIFEPALKQFRSDCKGS